MPPLIADVNQSDPGTAIPRLADGVAAERTAQGHVRLASPPMKRTYVHKLLARLLTWPERMQVELDDIGTFVVDRFDGRPLRAIANDLADHFRLSKRESEVALADFVRLLSERKLIRCDHPNVRQQP